MVDVKKNKRLLIYAGIALIISGLIFMFLIYILDYQHSSGRSTNNLNNKANLNTPMSIPLKLSA